jgi:GT2 family glycosyltransferase
MSGRLHALFGGGDLLLAAPPGMPGQTAVLLGPGAPPQPGHGLPVVRAEAAAPDADLVVISPDALTAAFRGRATGRAIRRLRRASGAIPIAAPASPAGRFDEWDADVVLSTCPPDAATAQRRAHAAAIRAAGRPLLVDVIDPATEVDAVVAAIDVGAAGALVRTGDVDSDRALVAGVAAAERARLHDAPMVSVVVCVRDGERVLPACLASLEAVRHPRFEVIVCDDGSTDGTRAIAAQAQVRLLALEPGGLSRARNAGIAASQGSIVAFLDADAEATPRWLEHLWRAIDRTGAAGAGGPNVPVPGVGWQERVVSGAPGPAIPAVHADGACLLAVGCNMAFRRDALLAIGGFREELTSSGDDVDVCLRLAQHGHRLTYAPQAVVLHHRRDSIAAFLRQQRGYRRSLGGLSEAPRPLHRRVLRAVLTPPRHAFRGPEPRQLYAVTNRPLSYALPLRSVLAVAALSAIGASRMSARGRATAWGTAACVNAAWIGALGARVPVHEAPRGPLGVLQRLATLALWLVHPLVRRK